MCRRSTNEQATLNVLIKEGKKEKKQLLQEREKLHKTGSQCYGGEESQEGFEKEENEVYWRNTCI